MPKALQPWSTGWYAKNSLVWMQWRQINCIFEKMHETENNFYASSNMLTTAIFTCGTIPSISTAKAFSHIS